MPKDEELQLDTLQDVLDAAGPDEEEEQADFESAYSETQPVTDTKEENTNAGKDKDELDTGDEPTGQHHDDGNDDTNNTDDGTGDEPTGQAVDKKAGQAVDQDPNVKRIRQLEGRFGELNAKYLKLLEQVENVTDKKGGESPSREEIRQAMGSSEKMEVLRNDYPEWADALTEVTEITATYVRDKIPDRNSIVQEARAMAYLDIKHPGWNVKGNSDDFRQWIETQPADIQAQAYSDDPDDVLEVLDNYDKRVPNNGEQTDGDDSQLNQASNSGDQQEEGHDAAEGNQQRSNGTNSNRHRLESAVAPTRGNRQRPAKAASSDEEDFVTSYHHTRGSG